jgi:uncharacterized protein (DUF2147 family)
MSTCKYNGLRVLFNTLLLFFIASNFAYAQEPSNLILGKWISLQGNVIIQVYKDSYAFKGKVIWFRDTDDKSRPMTIRTDMHNPDINLQSRKILGLEVLDGLTYNARSNCWENGRIYDVKTGRVWSSTIWMESEDLLKVRGFWHFEFIGRTMTFKRL